MILDAPDVESLSSATELSSTATTRETWSFGRSWAATRMVSIATSSVSSSIARYAWCHVSISDLCGRPARAQQGHYSSQTQVGEPLEVRLQCRCPVRGQTLDQRLQGVHLHRSTRTGYERALDQQVVEGTLALPEVEVSFSSS